jgi:hypothetical protein
MVNYNAFNVDPNAQVQQNFANVMGMRQAKEARDQQEFQNAMAMRQQNNREAQNVLENQRYDAAQAQQSKQADYNIRRAAMQYAVQGTTPDVQTARYKSAYKQLSGQEAPDTFQFIEAGTMSKSLVKTPDGGQVIISVPTQNLMQAMDFMNNPANHQDPKAFGESLNQLGVTLEPVAPQKQASTPKSIAEQANQIFAGYPPEQQTAANYRKLLDQLGVKTGGTGGGGSDYQAVNSSQGIYSFDKRTGKRVLWQDEASGKAILPQGSDAQIAGEKKKQEELSKARVKFATAYPKVRAQMTDNEQKWRLALQQIEKAKKLIGPMTTGFGSWLKAIPTTSAYRLQHALDTVKAQNIVRGIQTMRQNSPTGAAMGNMTEYEDKLFAALEGSMEQSQSGKDLLANLNGLEDRIKEARAAAQQYFNEDYADFSTNRSTTPGTAKDNGNVGGPAGGAAPAQAPASAQAEADAFLSQFEGM